MDDHIAGKDNVITELRLYNEIVYQICTNYDKFKDAGLSKEEMEQTLAKIEMSVGGLHTEGSAVAVELKNDILSAAEIGKKRVEAVFAANAQTKTVQAHSDGGEN